MGLWQWLRNLFARGGDNTVHRLQREVVLQEDKFRSIYKQLRALATRRAELMGRLRQAVNEDEARLVAQSLVALDTQDKSLRSEWAQVEIDTSSLHSALATAVTTVTTAQARRREKLLERTERLMRERALAEEELRQAEQRTRMVIEAAEEVIQRAREGAGTATPATQSYVALWRQSHQQATPQPPQPEPPSRA